MIKMKNNYVVGNKGKREFMNEISWNTLPDETLRQLGMVGITNAKKYEKSRYRISLEDAPSNLAIIGLILGFFIMIYVALIAGFLGNVIDLQNSGSRIAFGAAYLFTLFTITTVYMSYYEENWKKYILEVNSYPNYMLKRCDEDDE